MGRPLRIWPAFRRIAVHQLAFGVTAITDGALLVVYALERWPSAAARRNRGCDRRGRPFSRGYDPSSFRCSGLARSVDLALNSHSAGQRARCLRYFRGLGCRARKLHSTRNSTWTRPRTRWARCGLYKRWVSARPSASPFRTRSGRECPASVPTPFALGPCRARQALYVIGS
jgi:hypothetical protein